MRGQEAREQAERRTVMATLAHAAADEIAKLWDASGLPSDAELLRGPETGLVTVRGRIGGGGAPFNVGEATVTRATVRLASG
ncbi:MAG: phosphonate C-P lyase system protein PhnG, partial [Mesorhizobium sp.]